MTRNGPAARLRWLTAGASALALLTAARAEAAEGQTQTYRFDIPAEDLGAVLRAVGDTSQTQLLFSPDLVRGRTSGPVRGRLSADDALRQALNGSRLVFRRTASNVILISEAAGATPVPQVAPAVAAVQSEAAAVAPTSLEEIIVTGGKRPENVQNVPSSVFVATAAAMERAQVRDFDDLVRIAPSLTITKTSQPANNSINIRGIGTYAYSIATESSVAVVIDDIPQAFQAAAFSALVDVRQVEVLRGPQNTLFGKAASAGVVNITTEPATSTFTAHAELLATDDHEARAQATVSGPLGEQFRFRLAGDVSHYRGNIYNLGTGHWVNGQSDNTLRGKLVWDPDQAWEITLSPYYTHTIASCCQGAEYFVSPGVTFAKNNIPQSVILAGVTPGPDNINSRMDVDARGDSLDYGAGLKIAKQLGGGFSLASITSYDRYDLHDLQDTDSSDFDFQTVAPTAPHGGSANGGYFKINSATEELRLTSPSSGRLRYVGGLYFSRTGSERYFVRGSNTLGTYNGLSSLPTTNSTAYAAYISNAYDTNAAAFGQATYALTDRLDLIGGLRVNYEKISYKFYDLGNHVTYGDPACSTQSPTVPIQTCNNDTSVTGKAGAEYHVTPALMAFATYSRGYKGMAYDLTSTLTTRSPVASGPLKGVPTADAVAAHQPVPPETVDSYELGFKSTLLDNHLVLNLTIFDEEFRGFQAQSRDQLTGQNILNSIGKVYSRGVETEATALVTPELTLSVAAAYDKAVMVSFPNANCFGAQTVAQGCVGGQQDLSGKPLFNAPKWNLSASGEYDVPTEVRGLRPFVSGSFHWQSQVVYNLLQDPDSVQKPYGIFNLAAGVRNDHLRLTVFANNLFDQRYALTRGRDAQFNISQTATPPTDALTWKPARDSFRYFGVRLGLSY
jgi:iron complex outermembrane receptor protein